MLEYFIELSVLCAISKVIDCVIVTKTKNNTEIVLFDYNSIPKNSEFRIYLKEFN